MGRPNSVQTAAAQTANNIWTLEVGLMCGAIGVSRTMLRGSVLALVVTSAIWRAVPAIRQYRYP